MKKPGIIRRFFSFLFRLIVVAALMVLIAAGSFEGVTYYLTGSLYDFRNVLKSDANETVKSAANVVKEETVTDDKNMKNILFFVESEDGLSRYSSLVMMNKETKAVDLLLIPLHVQVTVGGKMLSDIQERISDAGSTLELDDIARVYGDEKYSIISDIFSQIFAVNITGYDVVTQTQFESLLDMNGDVPYQFSDILSYRDNKGNLKYFESGDQKLSGSQAMILISHMDGTDKQESARLERTNTYLETWIDRLTSAGKGADLVEYVEKNAVSSQNRDFTEEKEVWGDITPGAVTLRILQGAESKGIFSIDSQKAKLQISTLVKQSAEYDSSDDQDSVANLGDDYETAASSKDYYIELYNAAFRAGLASEWESYLEEEGYNISLIDSYQDEGPLSTTRIIVNQEDIGQDLLKYFPGARIETDEIETGGDIQVYIGTDSINVGAAEDASDRESLGTSSDSDSEDSTSVRESGKKTDSDKEDKDSKKKKKKEKEKDKDSGSSSGYYDFASDSE